MAERQSLENSRKADMEESKLLRLIDFLTRLASLRTKVIRDLGEYPKVLWLKDIPHQKGCFCQVWGRDEEYDSDVWIEVQNRREPELPSVPDVCKDWIEKSVLWNKNDLPELLPQITRQIRNPDWREGSDQLEFIQRTERLVDHPEVQKAWDRYIEECWLPWVDKHNAWESIHRVYTSLFSIYQEQLRLGEEYELVVGLGLLTWQTPSGQRVLRHLIVANALLDFEARLGKFVVRPHPEGANVRPELDMLDIEEQPARAEETAKSSLANAADDPWEKSCIEWVLKALVHSINPDGEYRDTLEAKSERGTTKPIVEYAPALILRKRSVRGLTETLKRIKERIEKGELIPSEFADLAELSERNDTESLTGSDELNVELDGDIFFPKHSNEEQRRIVEKLRIANGVLVQGPPGTGKSHTIANLICHLLVTGQRILVTAKTPRALRVLERLLPEEIRPLCINLLGEGLEEKRSLETSVQGILRKNEEWDEKRTEAELEKLDKTLRNLRQEKAEIERRLRAMRESETHSQTIADGAYRGTAAQIAQAVNRDNKEFEWFKDVVPLDKECPISENDLRWILDSLRWLTPEKRQELSVELPESLPLPELFAELVKSEEKAIEEERRSAVGADEQIANYLSKIDDADIQAMIDCLSAFQNEYRRLSSSSYPWVQDAIRDVVNGNSSSWSELCRVTRETITSIEKLVPIADDIDVDVPDSINRRTLLEDICKLKEHMEKGGKLGWWLFRPKTVKERVYVLKKVRVNGRPCRSLEQFQRLANGLRVRVEFEKVWGLWSGRREKPQKQSYVMELEILKDLCKSLQGVLYLENPINQYHAVLKKYPHIPEPIWVDESYIKRLIASCRFARVRREKRRAVDEIQKIEASVASFCAQSDVHAVTYELFNAIRNRNVNAFARNYSKINKLRQENESVQKLDEKLKKLRQVMPKLAEDLEQTYNESYWEERIKWIRDAWHWAQARIWLEEYIRKEEASALAKRMRQIDDEINAIIAKIASLRAWTFCFSRLQEDHRRHMEAWRQSMRRLGKGTGKHAPRHRREAQKHLNECREAVPAWVMPLHRVWDTVDPAPGMFDVVIVDEASQCGFEGLPLFYLGKKILIVGDDKQISPEEGFIDKNAVFQLMEQFLYDFDYKDSFHRDASLFDHGKLRYGKRRITLQEHFRCMPEIIQFSNELCYRDTPLIPLRQYGPDRLPPVKHVFIADGYREGSTNRAINRPEADAIVEKIVELCQDPRYEGKTMGVIVLQGDAQAGLIEEKLLGRLGAEEMEKRRLICGNPYSFQGDERDIIFLSMVAAPNERIGPFTKTADERRFNVAASRARDQMWLFHSVTCDDLSPFDLRRRLLEFFKNTKPQEIAGIKKDELERRAGQENRSVVKPPKPFDSWFEVDVALELLRKGFTVIPQYEVAGKRIDLVVEGGSARLAVECDGDEFHNVDQYEQDMQRQRMLERCGWVFFRVRASQYYADKQTALKDLWSLLEERGIHPYARKNTTQKTETIDQKEHDLNISESKQEVKQKNHQSEPLDTRVEVGDTVVYVDVEDPKRKKQVMITTEKSNPEWGTVNINTPIARAILDGKLGDVVEAILPVGTKKFQIVKILKNQLQNRLKE